MLPMDFCGVHPPRSVPRRAAPARAGRDGRPGLQAPGGALRRPAAARRHRARARQRPADPRGRRAHRQPRLHDGGRRLRPVRAARDAGQDHRHGDARQRHRRRASRRSLHVHDGEIVERSHGPSSAECPAGAQALGTTRRGRKVRPRPDDRTRSRTRLVVLSIAVGIFAIVVVMGGRGSCSRGSTPTSCRPTPARPSSSRATSTIPGAPHRDPERRARRRRSAPACRPLRAGDGAPRPRPPAGRRCRCGHCPLRQACKVQKLFPDRRRRGRRARARSFSRRACCSSRSSKSARRITVEPGDGDSRAAANRRVRARHQRRAGEVLGRRGRATSPWRRSPISSNPRSSTTLRSHSTAGCHRPRPVGSPSTCATDVLAPAGVQVFRTTVPKPGSHLLGDIFKAVSLLLLALGVMSLALSGFLVVTTISALMAQQIKQVGIMKAVGGRGSRSWGCT